MFHDDKHVISGDAVIMWDGVTRPETADDGTKVFSLKVALVNNDPTLAELNKIATDCLGASKFKGNMPPGGIWPFQVVDPTAFEGMLPSHISINSKTRRGAPQVFDLHGQELNPMHYAALLYPGAIVRVLVHTYDFDNVQKGVAFGLDGIQLVNVEAPRLPVGGINAAAAFGSPTPGVAPPTMAPPAMAAPPGVAPPTMAPPTMAAPPGIAPPTMAPPAMAAPPGVAPPTMAPPTMAAPPAAPDFLTPGGGGSPKKMTAKAGSVPYENYIAQGWTDTLLIEHGYMLSQDGIPF